MLANNGIVRADKRKTKPRPLTNFKIQKYYQNDAGLSSKNKPKFNGVLSKNNFPKIKDRAYVINLDECANIGTHWVAISVKNDLATYFDSFGVEHVPKEF